MRRHPRCPPQCFLVPDCLRCWVVPPALCQRRFRPFINVCDGCAGAGFQEEDGLIKGGGMSPPDGRQTYLIRHDASAAPAALLSPRTYSPRDRPVLGLDLTASLTPSSPCGTGWKVCRAEAIVILRNYRTDATIPQRRLLAACCPQRPPTGCVSELAPRQEQHRTASEIQWAAWSNSRYGQQHHDERRCAPHPVPAAFFTGL